MAISFFKVPRHKVFNYTPRFYDEEKERREERRKQLGLADDEPAEGPVGSLLRNGAMRTRHESFSQRVQSQKRRSQLFLILLIVGMSLVAYLLIQEFADEFIEVLFKR